MGMDPLTQHLDPLTRDLVHVITTACEVSEKIKSLTRENTEWKEQMKSLTRENAKLKEQLDNMKKTFCDCGRNGGYRCVCDRITRGREDSRDCP